MTGASGTNAVPALRLSRIQLGRIKNGGYIISYDGSLPSGTTLWLGVPDLNAAMDVTRMSHRDLLDSASLPRFLSLIGAHKSWWGATGRCRLFLKRGHSVIAQSNEQTFACPVRPYVGRLIPGLGKVRSGSPLRYTGTPPNYPDGRVLYMPAIDGCYYFAFAGVFETNNNKRGFNCITYVGAVLGVDVNSGAMGERGLQLADYVGCVPCDCENRTLLEVRIFFRRNPVGTYLMFSDHHVVLVVGGVVHEFREKLSGYNAQPIGAWSHGDSRWTVRKAPFQF